jgi:hypothetical protein
MQAEFTLPQEVLDRVAEGRPGKLEVKGEAYRIKLTASQLRQLNEHGYNEAPFEVEAEAKTEDVLRQK